MEMPSWWDERRYGLLVDVSLAAVPSWAPIGQDAAMYRRHLDAPLVEVLAHHRDRWDHIERFDDFLELLTFDHFDAEEWARLAVDAGAGYAMAVARDADGVCWWDAPDALTVLDDGPRRNVLAEFAAACERNDLVFGARYDLADGDSPQAVLQHTADLVDRYAASVVRLERAVDAASSIDEVCAHLRGLDADLVLIAPSTDADTVAVFDEMPDDIVTEPWELRRTIGRSIGFNRNERHEHHLSGFDIVALLTEVVAKGGHLLLTVGARSDGSIPSMQADPLRDAGTWIRTHGELLARAQPWTTWGDEQVCYVTVDGVVHAIDLGGTGRFAAIDAATYRAVAVERVGGTGVTAMHFVQDELGLHLDLPRSSPWRRSALPIHSSVIDGEVVVDVAVYRLELDAVDKPDELFAPVERPPIDLAPLLDGAGPGEIVQLGDNVYRGPAVVPPGVILRGLGADRSHITGAPLTLGRNSRVEHLSVGKPGGTAVSISGQFASLLGCAVDGTVVVRADDALIRASRLACVVAERVDRLTVSRCALHGRRWDVGVLIDGGADHEIDSCEFADHLCGVRARDTTGTVVRGNTFRSRWWGIHLERTERAHVHGNRIETTMRAVDVDGGTAAVIDGNAVIDGDSGCVVQGGASECRVAGNHWERCRVGLIAWDVAPVHHQDNHVLSLHDPDGALVSGP